MSQNNEDTTPIQTPSEPEGQILSDCANCASLHTRCADSEAKWLRAQADYQNLQKETAQRRSEWAAMSELQILQEFIPLYDHLKMAFAHQPASAESTKNWNNWASGIGLIMKQFGDVLRAHGIEEIKTVGEIFDPTRHETVGEEESGEYPAHTVVREVDGGYVMKGKVVKVAKVVVVKAEEIKE